MRSNRGPRKSPIAMGAALVVCLAVVWPVYGQTPAPSVSTEVPGVSTEKSTPYDSRLARLSEILGAVQYLRNLCSKEAEPGWREAMQALIDAEAANEPSRKARLVSAYNRGYRSFASVYTRCTPAAVRAETRYRNEGATLATEITARYGN